MENILTEAEIVATFKATEGRGQDDASIAEFLEENPQLIEGYQLAAKKGYEKAMGEYTDSLAYEQGAKAERTRIRKEVLELLEPLSELEHEQWNVWRKELERRYPNIDKSPWIDVPYSVLGEDTKEHDRKWARKIIEILEKLLGD